MSDLEEARSWYNLQPKGLGTRLITDVKSVISSIKQNPYFASVKFENLRTTAWETFALCYPIIKFMK